MKLLRILPLAALFAFTPAQSSASITPSINSISAEIEHTSAEKYALLEPYMNATTRCIIKTLQQEEVAAEKELNDRIVSAFIHCSAPARELVRQHDELYGPGSGEVFFNGPYLDVLPAQVKEKF